MDQGSINIRHFMIVSLGGNALLHSYIDQLYSERKWEYYECYRKSEIYNDHFIPRHVTKNEEKMKQVAGIVEWCYQNNDFELIYRLIKRGYKFVYQYVQQNRIKGVDFDQFEMSFLKKFGGHDKVTDLQLFYGACIVLYLCYKEEIKYSLRRYGRLFVEAMRDLSFEIVAKSFRFSKENKERYKGRIDDLFRHYDIPRNMRPMSIGKFFELLIDKQIINKGAMNLFSSVQDVRSEVFKEGTAKYIGSLSNWIKLNGMNEMDLTESVIISKEDVENVFLDFIIAKQPDGNRLSDQDRDLYLMSLLYIQALSSIYLETKHLYLDDSQEKHYIELKDMENRLKENETIFTNEKLRIQAMEKSKDDKIAQLEEELIRTQKTLQQTEQELEKREDHSKEVAALRDYIYTLNNENEVMNEFNQEDLISKVQKKKIAIIGGHTNWINKMKEILPNATFVEIEHVNRDLGFLDKLDAVFVYWSVFNHKFYKKLMIHMNSNKVDLHYIGRKTNIELTLQEIEKALR